MTRLTLRHFDFQILDSLDHKYTSWVLPRVPQELTSEYGCDLFPDGPNITLTENCIIKGFLVRILADIFGYPKSNAL